MTKEEKIKEAWGNSYDHTVDADGWKHVSMHDFQFKYNTSIAGEFQGKGYDPFKTGRNSHIQNVFVRPNQLKNLDLNNGWTKINTRSDLPISEGMYLFHTVQGRNVEQWHSEDVSIGGVTHWRPIVQIPKPLY
jgi:hypothetical protein